MKRIRTAILVVAAVTTASCATSPTGRDQLTLFSPAAMQDMGAAAFNDIKAETPAAGAFLNRYVECVANPIVGVLPGRGSQGWEVRVFDRDEPNAFALPGRKIGVYKGLLDVTETQDQLAAVIGHEIGHVLARHGNERMSGQFMVQTGMAAAAALTRSRESPERRRLMAVLGLGAQVGILLPYSRSHETEADRMGLELMARAGFDPRASVGPVAEHGPGVRPSAGRVPVHPSRARDPDQGPAVGYGRGDGPVPAGEGGRPRAGLRRVTAGDRAGRSFGSRAP